MKKLLLLLPIVLLTACDRPLSSTELTCELDIDWQNNTPIHLSNDAKIALTQTNINLQTFNNYAKITIDGITTTFEKIIERQYGQNQDTSYKGNFPDSTRTAVLTISKDTQKNEIFDYVIEFTSIQVIEDNGDNVTLSFSCIPTTNKK